MSRGRPTVECVSTNACPASWIEASCTPAAPRFGQLPNTASPLATSLLVIASRGPLEVAV
jgi:hypothetical protein